LIFEAMIRVMIFEDNQDLAEGLSGIIDESGDLELCGIFSNAKDAARKVTSLRPDVILMDIDMPGTGGMDGLREIRQTNEAVSLLMFTVFDDNHYIFQAICEGATGYLLKTTEPDKLLQSIREAYNGGSPMTPVIARKVLKLFSEPFRSRQELMTLTAREHDVLKQLVRGMSYKMIASVLQISTETVSSHVKNIYQKLHVNSKSEAVARAIQNRLV
jgi:DNA-binding NarL/FixJ family response regulator